MITKVFQLYLLIVCLLIAIFRVESLLRGHIADGLADLLDNSKLLQGINLFHNQKEEIDDIEGNIEESSVYCKY